jgi:hypothetical protein
VNIQVIRIIPYSAVQLFAYETYKVILVKMCISKLWESVICIWNYYCLRHLVDYFFVCVNL